MQENHDAEIKKLRNDCLELEEQVKLLVRTELKLRRTQAELLESKEQIEEYNKTLELRVEERTKKLIESEAELSRSNKELEQFAYIVSHDLQEPLRIVASYILLMRKEGVEGKSKGYLERMQNAIKRMQELIKGLLDFSRVSTSGQLFKTVNLEKTITDVIIDLETAIRDTGGSIETGKLPVVKADALQMRQLFQNFISNALKFHKHEIPPVVKLYLLEDNKSGFNRIIVEDNGIGIDIKDHGRIFNAFQRLHGRSEYEGSGIGLAICKKIVERHYGRIDIESELNSGTKFIISLPSGK